MGRLNSAPILHRIENNDIEQELLLMQGRAGLPNSRANVREEVQLPDPEQILPPSEVPSGPGDIRTVPWEDIAAKIPEDTGNAESILEELFGVG
jgi:hypothetical protein